MRFDRLLAGSALSLVLAASVSAQAGSDVVAGLAGPSLIEPAALIVKPSDIDRTAPGARAPDVGAAPEADDGAAIALPEPAELTVTPADIRLAPPAQPDRARNAIALPEPVEATFTPADLGKDPGTTASIPQPATPLAPATPATETSAPPEAPAVALDPLGEKLRDFIAKTSDRQFDRKARASLDSFYAARKYEPIWTDKGALAERAKAVMAQLRAADADGLDPSDYVVAKFDADAGPDALAEFEYRLTAAVLAYARHAAVGRVHWSHVARDIHYEQTPPDPAETLGKLATAADARAALDGYNPQHPAYKALKAKLAEARGRTDDNVPRIAAGPTLKIGMQDARVPELRDRLGVSGEAGNITYDKPLAEAVKAFQKQKGIAANGNFTQATVDAMNGVRADARNVDVILANLERWRWVPHDLGRAHVIVNIPEFMLRVYKDGQTLWTTRVVVGKPSTATPLLTETMKFITVNPTWNVPPSIVYGEYLPALQQDPTVLARMGLRVSYAGGGVHISQPPGPANALGRIRFNFPNKFLVYQHDTPDKHYFAHERRAYSHGCMRVQDPDKYAEVLLSIALPEQNYTAARIRGMYGSGEVNLNFPTPIPVHLTYQTAYVDAAGKLVLREDIYGRDSRVIAGLKAEERRVVVDAPAAEGPRRSASSAPRRQVYAPPQPQYRGWSFFGLFR